MPAADTHFIDPFPYLRLPSLGVDSGLSLAKRLMTMVPADPSPGLIKMAEALAVTTDVLEERSNARAYAQPPSRDPRPADIRLDRAWGAVDARLRTWGIFTATDPERETAVGLRERLFPTGLDFLTLPFDQQHAQSERRIRMIEDEDLRGDLDEFAGEAFVQELMDAHAAYGEVLGITASVEPRALPITVKEPLRALTEAISRYALQVIAFAELDPANGEPARRALTPIDELRQAMTRRSGRAGLGAAEPLDQPEDESTSVDPDESMLV